MIETPSHAEKVNILLVDDRPEGLFALQAVLQNPYYNLVSASSGEEALRHFLRDDFAVVLLDVQMPGIDGFEAARLMHRSQSTSKTPIIFVTAISVEDRYVYEGYEAGAVDYIFKPFDPTILRSKVAVFVYMYRMHMELQRQAELLRESERKDRERLLAELELESLRRYQNLADAVPHIVWKAQPDGTLEYFNKVWFDFTGLSLDQSTGKGWLACLHEDDQAGLKKLWEDSTSLGSAFETECRIKRKSDDTYRWHVIKAVPEFNLSGKVVSWVGTCTDNNDRKLVEEERAQILRLEQQARCEAELAIARRRQAEQAIIRAKEDAEEANRAKTQLVANMSHEIRTPLGIVLGFSELLLDPHQSAEARVEAVQTILRNGQQLSKLVDDILDISKVEAGRMDTEAIPFSLHDLLDDLRNEVELEAKDKGLQVSMVIDSDVPDAIITDPMRLKQILANVIGNAVKFTERGEIRLEVRAEDIADDTDRLRLRFDIEDTGIGIPVTQQRRLFQDFMQADSSTTRRFGGTGLGLALSRRLCRILGGDLVLADSVEGSGSRFHLWINARPMDQTIKGNTVKPNIMGFPIVQLERLDGIKMLLVDDSEDNQTLIKHIVKRLGGDIDVASDGYAALENIDRNDYQVILMDIQMPRLDGYETVKILREKGCDKPIIALTAHAMKDERDRCMRIGFDGHLCKPINWRELVEQVRGFAHGDVPPLVRMASPVDQLTEIS